MGHGLRAVDRLLRYLERCSEGAVSPPADRSALERSWYSSVCRVLHRGLYQRSPSRSTSAYPAQGASAAAHSRCNQTGTMRARRCEHSADNDGSSSPVAPLSASSAKSEGSRRGNHGGYRRILPRHRSSPLPEQRLEVRPQCAIASSAPAIACPMPTVGARTLSRVTSAAASASAAAPVRIADNAPLSAPLGLDNDRV